MTEKVDKAILESDKKLAKFDKDLIEVINKSTKINNKESKSYQKLETKDLKDKLNINTKVIKENLDKYPEQKGHMLKVLGDMISHLMTAESGNMDTLNKLLNKDDFYKDLSNVILTLGNRLNQIKYENTKNGNIEQDYFELLSKDPRIRNILKQYTNNIGIGLNNIGVGVGNGATGLANGGILLTNGLIYGLKKFCIGTIHAWGGVKVAAGFTEANFGAAFKRLGGASGDAGEFLDKQGNILTDKGKENLNKKREVNKTGYKPTENANYSKGPEAIGPRRAEITLLNKKEQITQVINKALSIKTEGADFFEPGKLELSSTTKDTIKLAGEQIKAATDGYEIKGTIPIAINAGVDSQMVKPEATPQFKANYETLYNQLSSGDKQFIDQLSQKIKLNDIPNQTSKDGQRYLLLGRTIVTMNAIRGSVGNISSAIVFDINRSTLIQGSTQDQAHRFGKISLVNPTIELKQISQNININNTASINGATILNANSTPNEKNIQNESIENKKELDAFSKDIIKTIKEYGKENKIQNSDIYKNLKTTDDLIKSGLDVRTIKTKLDSISDSKLKKDVKKVVGEIISTLYGNQSETIETINKLFSSNESFASLVDMVSKFNHKIESITYTDGNKNNGTNVDTFSITEKTKSQFWEKINIALKNVGEFISTNTHNLGIVTQNTGIALSNILKVALSKISLAGIRIEGGSQIALGEILKSIGSGLKTPGDLMANIGGNIKAHGELNMKGGVEITRKEININNIAGLGYKVFKKPVAIDKRPILRQEAITLSEEKVLQEIKAKTESINKTISESTPFAPGKMDLTELFKTKIAEQIKNTDKVLGDNNMQIDGAIPINIVSGVDKQAINPNAYDTVIKEYNSMDKQGIEKIIGAGKLDALEKQADSWLIPADQIRFANGSKPANPAEAYKAQKSLLIVRFVKTFQYIQETISQTQNLKSINYSFGFLGNNQEVGSKGSNVDIKVSDTDTPIGTPKTETKKTQSVKIGTKEYNVN